MRFRFTIRDLLWLTALVAMGIGWWLDRASFLKQIADQDKAIYQLQLRIDQQQTMGPKQKKSNPIILPSTF